MTDVKAPTRPKARDTFRNEGVCVATGYACELGFDCRKCNVPIAMGQVQICNSILEIRNRMNIIREKAEHKECECNDKETGTE